MLRSLHNIKAQSNIGEYALTFFLVIAVISTMTIYVRRGLQARIYDARNVVREIAKSRSAEIGNLVDGNVIVDYEPYYARTYSNRDVFSQTSRNLTTGAQPGIFKKMINEQTQSSTTSVTLPPSFENFQNP
ncbi:MAG: hypothetical protein HQL24_09635 [Candidatus Omnitrophica bacterium]|nr:hypothetical protein [Candidatus Omnitrophota bacterium]